LVTRAHTVAFLGVEAKPVEVQCAIAPGLPAFNLVGLADKAVSESKERVRAALAAVGLAIPPSRITINLSPADLPKAGSHYDLPIALALMAALGVVPSDVVDRHVAMGELSLDGEIKPVQGALPAAVAAAAQDRGLICPEACGREAAWVGACEIVAPPSLIALVNHFAGRDALPAPEPGPVSARHSVADSPAWRARATSTASGPIATRTTRPRWPRSSAGERTPSRARSASRIAACCSLTSCPSSRAPCSKRCASRSRRAKP
jgi:magnesium chelatase family protein